MQVYLVGQAWLHLLAPKIFMGGGITDKNISGIPAHLPKISGGVQLAVQAFGGSFSDAGVSCREYDLSNIHRSDAIRGGFDQIEHEDIHGGRDTVFREEKYRGGFDVTIKKWKPYILESFYYADADTERLLPYYGDFLLDSGAFTFMEQNGKSVNWDDYADRYIDFINRNRIEKYIELDLDYIIGCEGARKLRTKLESKTGRKSIPVWHPIRGKDEFLRMCDEYDYVALGGIVGQKWRGTEQFMPWFIKEAHKRKTKIHGLGFTKLAKLGDYHFDSVDSTAWTTGNRFGYLYFFNGTTMEKKDKPKGMKLGDSRKVALHNYCEWIKFQKWADTHL